MPILEVYEDKLRLRGFIFLTQFCEHEHCIHIFMGDVLCAYVLGVTKLKTSTAYLRMRLPLDGGYKNISYKQIKF